MVSIVKHLKKDFYVKHYSNVGIEKMRILITYAHQNAIALQIVVIYCNWTERGSKSNTRRNWKYNKKIKKQEIQEIIYEEEYR